MRGGGRRKGRGGGLVIEVQTWRPSECHFESSVLDGPLHHLHSPPLLLPSPYTVTCVAVASCRCPLPVMPPVLRKCPTRTPLCVDLTLPSQSQLPFSLSLAPLASFPTPPPLPPTPHHPHSTPITPPFIFPTTCHSPITHTSPASSPLPPNPLSRPPSAGPPYVLRPCEPLSTGRNLSRHSSASMSLTPTPSTAATRVRLLPRHYPPTQGSRRQCQGEDIPKKGNCWCGSVELSNDGRREIATLCAVRCL